MRVSFADQTILDSIWLETDVLGIPAARAAILATEAPPPGGKTFPTAMSLRVGRKDGQMHDTSSREHDDLAYSILEGSSFARV